MTYSGRVADNVAVLPDRLVTARHPMFGAVAEMIWSRDEAYTSGTWQTANDPIAVPFRLHQPETVYQLGWYNGSGTMTDSVDVGIYNASWVRLISTGGTARSGVSALQFVNVTDTVLAPGDYYVAMVSNGVTANNDRGHTAQNSAAALGMAGQMYSTTDAYPLPDPLTNMVANAVANRVPGFVIAFRALV